MFELATTLSTLLLQMFDSPEANNCQRFNKETIINLTRYELPQPSENYRKGFSDQYLGASIKPYEVFALVRGAVVAPGKEFPFLIKKEKYKDFVEELNKASKKFLDYAFTDTIAIKDYLSAVHQECAKHNVNIYAYYGEEKSMSDKETSRLDVMRRNVSLFICENTINEPQAAIEINLVIGEIKT